MITIAPNSKRKQQILTGVVHAYIESGQPVSSRAISQRNPESLSPASIRNAMAELEEEGFLYQPHTSAGRVPTAAGYRFFAQAVSAEAKLDPEDQEWIRSELAAATTPGEVAERAGHVLASMSRGLGIIVSPSLAKSVLEHIRFMLLPDGRVVTVLVSAGGVARDKILRPARAFTQEDLDRTAEYLNREYAGRTLATIRADLLARLAGDQERYDQLVRNALELCDPRLLGENEAAEVHVEGAAQIAAAPDFADQAQLRELLAAIEEREKLVALLSSCIDEPEAVHVQIGIEGISAGGGQLTLISAPYAWLDQAQGSIGVLGPMRMHYERAITAVAYVARLFSEAPGRS
ncbi:MAG: heat-inducible transcriptional repressor HrcA [Candidatus Acidiferrales bacterium]|jgi:heat-inducible transcriptional repressor